MNTEEEHTQDDEETPPTPGAANEKVVVRDNVHFVLTDTKTGEIKAEWHGENLITDVGDGFLGQRLYDDTQDIVSGFRAGEGSTPASKNGAGAAIGSYVAGGSIATTSVISYSRGAGLGSVTEYRTVWPAGVATGLLTEFVLTTETPIGNTPGVEADTIARVVTPPFDKDVDRELSGKWDIEFLGS